MTQQNGTAPRQPRPREVAFYERTDNDQTHCGVCEFRCTIEVGGEGRCKVRRNVGGTLIAENYGYIAAAAFETIEQRHLYHLFPDAKVLTIGGWGNNFPSIEGEYGDPPRPYPLDRYLSYEKMTRRAVDNHCRGIVFAFNEPTMSYEYVSDVARLAKAQGLFTVLVTNGYITPEAFDPLGEYIDALRIEVNAFSERTFTILTGTGYYRKVLQTAARARRYFHSHVEVVTQFLPNVNDNAPELKTIASWIKQVLGENTAWHIMCPLPDTEQILGRVKELGHGSGLHYIYTQSGGTLHLENTYCHNCGHLLIERMPTTTKIRALEPGYGSNSEVAAALAETNPEALNTTRAAGQGVMHCTNCGMEVNVRNTLWRL